MNTDLTDEMLAVDAQNGNVNSVNLLLTKYKKLVNKLSRSYFLVGGEMEDIVQEGMIGLYKAIINFAPQKNVSFKTFASTCINHQIQNAIKVANSEKNKVLSSALSITNDPNKDDDEENLEVELPSDLPSPDDKIIEKEKLEEIKALIIKSLSPLEIRILSLYLKGYSYEKMSEISGISKKSIDNGLTRIKNKLSFLNK